VQNLELRLPAKAVTGQYGSSTVLQHMNDQSNQQCWCTHCFVRASWSTDS